MKKNILLLVIFVALLATSCVQTASESNNDPVSTDSIINVLNDAMDTEVDVQDEMLDEEFIEYDSIEQDTTQMRDSLY